MKRREQWNPLTSEELTFTRKLAKSREVAYARRYRAEIILDYNKGLTVTQIAHARKTNRPKIERTIDRVIAFGVAKGLEDLPRQGRPQMIPNESRQWVISLACQKPMSCGYPHDVWTYSLLVSHIRNLCVASGHKSLVNIGKSGLFAILNSNEIKPHKINYYLEKRDEAFEEKMANVLHVYKEVEILNNQDVEREMTTISYDEKPGIQAIKNISAQLPPVPGEHKTVSRDYEYKRLGTLSLLAGIDLHTGKIMAIVEDRHRSQEFISFLKCLDASYPESWKIRVILDNHSAHISKETQAYLKSRAGRFEFIFTPKHGSWLNLIEMFFSKLSRSVLRHIRVDSKAELKNRIIQGIDLFNQDPVIFRWKYKMDEISI